MIPLGIAEPPRDHALVIDVVGSGEARSRGIEHRYASVWMPHKAMTRVIATLVESRDRTLVIDADCISVDRTARIECGERSLGVCRRTNTESAERNSAKGQPCTAHRNSARPCASGLFLCHVRPAENE